jgi:amino acid transporter
MSVLIVIQFLIGLSLVCCRSRARILLTVQMVAASRQAWAFSRDGALPFSSFFRRISQRVRYQPARVICGLAVVVIVFGLLCLINDVAAGALFSLFVASNYVAWGTPILCRLIWGEDRFYPGEFYTGRFSRPIAMVAVAWLSFGLVLSMFPSTGPNPTRTFPPWFFCAKLTVPAAQMNYTVVLNGFVLIASMTYYFVYARKWYTGPRMTALNASSDSSLAEGTEGEAWESEAKHE